MFNINSLEKKPINGGTPAIEKRHIVIISKRLGSKLNEDMENKVLFLGNKLVTMEIKRTNNVTL